MQRFRAEQATRASKGNNGGLSGRYDAISPPARASAATIFMMKGCRFVAREQPAYSIPYDLFVSVSLPVLVSDAIGPDVDSSTRWFLVSCVYRCSTSTDLRFSGPRTVPSMHFGKPRS